MLFYEINNLDICYMNQTMHIRKVDIIFVIFYVSIPNYMLHSSKLFKLFRIIAH